MQDFRSRVVFFNLGGQSGFARVASGIASPTPPRIDALAGRQAVAQADDVYTRTAHSAWRHSAARPISEREETAIKQEFSTREIPSQLILGIRASTTMEQVPQLLGELFGEVYEFIQDQGQQPVGMPLTIYHSMDGDGLELECAMPVAAGIAGSGRITAGELPATLAAITTHIGPYDELPGAWSNLTDWMESQGLAPAGAPWEVYVTDPGAEPDPAKWRTDIVFPVSG
ncbi:MAG: GyrI-like domain-containing protein [Chloroflexota bacterium]|nr:GyrI-like domain-containing protein [Chloroflexota bacterium]